MSRRIKQVMIDCLASGKPHAVRATYYVVVDGEELRRVREVPVAWLSDAQRRAVAKLLGLTPDILDTPEPEPEPEPDAAPVDGPRASAD